MWAGGRLFFFFSSRRRHTRWTGDWSSDVCSSDLPRVGGGEEPRLGLDLALELSGGPAGVAYEELDGAVIMGHQPLEIGRASCRERGEISGAAVLLKKKKDGL